MQIRKETLADIEAIDDLLRDCFATAAEANLVKKLRDNNQLIISLVAISPGKNGHIIGCAMFSPVQLAKHNVNWCAIAPVAVSKEFRRQNVATKLISMGCKLLTTRDWSAVFILGNPIHYRSLGFISTNNLTCRWPVPKEYFMVKPLILDENLNLKGQVEYTNEFNQF